MYFQEEIETMEREQLEALQLERLQATVKKVYENVPFYTKKFHEVGVKPEDIKTLADLSKLPFTVKTDLRDNYPMGLNAVPREELVRVHASSGTTGKPTVVCYTEGDIKMWGDCVARGLASAGLTSADMFQVSYGYGLFTGGLGLHDGVQALGGVVLPTSSGNTQKQIMMMNDMGSNAIACTPSYALFLSEAIREAGLDPADLPLRAGIFGAEPWTEEMRKQLEARLSIKAYDIYGLSEVCGPGVGMECSEQAGIHIWEDNFLIEIVDPVTFEVLPEGETGEVVFTTITKEGMPVIRYRTKDLSSITREKCACGRTHVRMNRITGRSDDMLIIRGVNVFPSQVESVLLAMGKTAPHFHMVVDRVDNTDTLEIMVELDETFFDDQMKAIEALRKEISKEVQAVLGISAKITLVEPKTIPRSEGKNKLVTDKRKEQNINF